MKPKIYFELCSLQAIGLDRTIGLENGTIFPVLRVPTPTGPDPVKIYWMRPCSKTDLYFFGGQRRLFRFEKQLLVLKIYLTLFLAGASEVTFRFFLSHRQTSGAIKLKISDFVATFIAHILAKNILGHVRSGHQNRSRGPTSRVLLLKFEVEQKPMRSSDHFQTSEFCKCTST